MNGLKKEAITGVKWTSLSTGVKAFLQIFQLIILARFLSAEDFGLVAIVMVVIGFSQLFMDMGISNAIIHKQNITDIQLSSLYWLNILSGAILTIIVFLIAPMVSIFYNEVAIIPLLQLLSFSFLINATGNQYRVLLIKELKFNTLAKIELSAEIGAFICAVVLAVKGFGAYSLVYATLVNVIISNVILLIIGIKTHKPKMVYQHKEIIGFLTFGLYQMGQKSIVYFNNQFDVILIGKLLGTEVLGIYSIIKQLVMRPAQVINLIVAKVTFPIMAKIQDDISRLRSVYLKLINYLSSINFPIYILMVVLGSSLVPVLLGEKWINSIEIFQILSIYILVRSTMHPAGSLLLSRGRADVGFWWSVAELSLMPLIIYISSNWGIVGVSVGLLIFQILMLFPNWYFIVRKMCGANFIEYFYVQLQPLIAAFLSIVITFLLIGNSIENYLINIISYTIIFLGFYLVISYWLNKKFASEIKNILFDKGEK